MNLGSSPAGGANYHRNVVVFLCLYTLGTI